MGQADELVVVDCETEAIKETSVGQFFELFKDPAQRAAKGVWKLKVSSALLNRTENELMIRTGHRRMISNRPTRICITISAIPCPYPTLRVVKVS